MRKIKKQEKGITLMVLVVTIIILLILAAVTVRLVLDDNGVISETKGAINEWEKTTSDEESQVSKLASDMKKLRNRTSGSESGESGSEGENPGETADSPLKNIDGNETNNTETQDKYGNKIVIPAGFKVVNPEDDVTKGIVIEDVSAGDSRSKGNQYVWVPVSHVDGERTNIIKDSSGIEHTIELARYTFNTDGTVATKTIDGSSISSSYNEETAAEHTVSKYENTIAKDINGFKESVRNNGGYYIARYEAGDPTTNTDRATGASQTIVPVFKAGQVAYNITTQVNCAKLMRNLYSSQSSNYTHDLVNSYAWDTAIIFIQEFSGDDDYSGQIRLQGSLAHTGQAKNGEEYDIRCNICDMAGNLSEWTTETRTYAASPCCIRGNSWKSNVYTTSRRSCQSTGLTGTIEIGFRRTYIYIIHIS